MPLPWVMVFFLLFIIFYSIFLSLLGIFFSYPTFSKMVKTSCSFFNW